MMNGTGVLDRYRPKLETLVPSVPRTAKKWPKWALVGALATTAAGVAVWKITTKAAPATYGTATVGRQS
jgi:hypothetical protein